MSDLIGFYKKIISYAGMSANDSGALHIDVLDTSTPVVVAGLPAYLPTKQNLKNPEGKSIFHPLNENWIKGESEAFKEYKKALLFKLNSNLVSLMIPLVQLATSIDLQQRLSADGLDGLLAIGEADSKSLEIITKVLMAATKANPFGSVVDIYIKKGGTYNNQRFNSVGVVTFPMLKETFNRQERNEKLYGIKVRKHDYGLILNLINFLFPDNSKQEAYNDGSTSKTFRYMDALLRTSYKLSVRINQIVDMYAGVVPDIEGLKIDLSWADELSEWEHKVAEIRLVPNQDKPSVAGLEPAAEPTAPSLNHIEVRQPYPQTPTVQQHVPPHVPHHQHYAPPIVQEPSRPPTVDELLRMRVAGVVPAASVQLPAYQQQAQYPQQRLASWAVEQVPPWVEQPIYAGVPYNQPQFIQPMPIYPQPVAYQPPYQHPYQQPSPIIPPIPYR